MSLKQVEVKEAIMLKSFDSKFRENKTSFGKIHEFLIKKGIIDGSSDSLLEDILDSRISNSSALDIIVSKCGKLSPYSLIEKLVYIALSGAFRIEVQLRIRRMLILHLRECNTAFVKHDYDFMRELALNGEKLSDDQLTTAIKSRIKALKEVLQFTGEHFLKRSIFVAPGFKVDVTK